MKNKIKTKGRLKSYLNVTLYLGILLLAVNVALIMIDIKSAVLLGCFTLFYFIITALLLYRNKPIIMNELISFATEYGQIQRKLLRDMEIPYCLLDEGGSILWTNREFELQFKVSKGYNRSIRTIFKEIKRDMLPDEETEENIEIPLTYNDRDYRMKCKKVSLKDMAKNSEIISEEDYNGYLLALYFFDETALNLALKENDDQSLAVALLYVDNYEEVLESVEEVRRSLLMALIDRKINKYISSFDGISKKIEKDKFLIILRKRSVKELMSRKFEILEDVKTVNAKNDIPVSVSIGVGFDGLSYSQNYEFARAAIDLALGRGGDQAVVKSNEQITYFGGKSQQVEKNTRVKARVKALALREIIISKDRVIIMGHRNSDVDSFGAALGIYRIAKALDKKAYIVLETPTGSVSMMRELLLSKATNEHIYDEDMFVTGDQAKQLAGASAVLVVVDVNKPSITECPELIKQCKSIVVLDHHRQGTETIDNAVLSYVEPYASSTCEMVTEVLQYIIEGIKIRSDEADCMYAGIMIDTNNFVTKTGVRTFEAAAFLRRAGADVTRVHKLMRDDAGEYRAKAETVSRAEIYRDAYAFSICSPGDDVVSPTVIGAQAANELLNIKGIKASFVFTDYQNKINVSARSIDEVNVQIIMERMGGGGHMNTAACQLENIDCEGAIGQLKKLLDKMIEEGDI